MSTFKANFTTADVETEMKDFILTRVQKAIAVCHYVGIAFVNAARTKQTYEDDTGNLRSSIGYTIAYDGVIKESNIKGTAEGVARATEVSNELVKKNKGGIVLIGFAGMEYAYHVERNNFDVITGSIPEARALLSEFRSQLK